LLSHPVETFDESISCDCARCLDEPFLASEGRQTELICDLWDSHCPCDVLLVCKNKNGGCRVEVLVANEFVEFFFGKIDTLWIVGVDNEDDTVAVGEVVLPKDSDLVLTSEVPDLKVEVLELDFFAVEANGRDGGDCFAKFELVEDCGFACCVETDHEESDVLFHSEDS